MPEEALLALWKVIRTDVPAVIGNAPGQTVLRGYRPGQQPKRSRKATVKWLRLL